MRRFASNFKDDFTNTKKSEQFNLDRSVWNRFKQEHLTSISEILPPKIIKALALHVYDLRRRRSCALPRCHAAT